MKIEHIKVNGLTYIPMESGVQAWRRREGCYEPVCYIKKLMFGRFRIEYYDEFHPSVRFAQDNQTPNTRIIAYPSGIQEIKYSLGNED